MSDTAREWAERAGKAQEAVSELGAGPPAALDDTDRRMIAKAREVAALKTAEVMRERYGEADSEMARAAALGEAQFLLLELAAVIDRFGGQAAAQIAEAGSG